MEGPPEEAPTVWKPQLFGGSSYLRSLPLRPVCLELLDSCPEAPAVCRPQLKALIRAVKIVIITIKLRYLDNLSLLPFPVSNYP